MKTFEDYLRENLDKGIIDHQLRCEDCTPPPGNHMRFYIHAAGHNSDTPDFEVRRNMLFPIRENRTTDTVFEDTITNIVEPWTEKVREDETAVRAESEETK